MLASFDPYPIVRPLLHRLEPEIAHEVVLRALESGLVPRRKTVVDPVLATTFLGRPLAHPLGLAAGFDKNARVAAAMFGQGLSFVEVGGVTPRPQHGNPRPRVFRLPDDRAVINRMGFPNEGADAVERRLHARPAPGMLGVNIASNADSSDPVADFVTLARRFAPHCEYLMLDVSCPNTGNGKIFLEPAKLRELLSALKADAAGRRAALVAKLAPDIDDVALARLIDVFGEFEIGGLCVGNTTLERPAELRTAIDERGGLSGPPLFARSTAQLQFVRELVGSRIPLIGVGGIANGADAYAKIRAGASTLQLYTALIYRGPAVVEAILRDLARLLRADGFASVAEAVGSDIVSG